MPRMLNTRGVSLFNDFKKYKVFNDTRILVNRALYCASRLFYSRTPRI